MRVRVGGGVEEGAWDLHHLGGGRGHESDGRRRGHLHHHWLLHRDVLLCVRECVSDVCVIDDNVCACV